ncbi:MAG: hypothetical protein IT381_21245 [Deltaproteobacteria bacterium]|nr:hypothetical protein [Deltaproteobacteria bacterium]
METHKTSGYVDCACRDCFETAIASADDEVDTVLCWQCHDAGCDPHAGGCLVELDLDEDETYTSEGQR